MDPETIAAVGFMLFGIAFFTFMTWFVTSDANRMHQNRVNETREFGAPVEDPVRPSRRNRR